MSLAYLVEINYVEKGTIGAKVGQQIKKVKELELGLGRLGSSLASGFSEAMSTVGSMVSSLGTMGMAGIAAVSGMSVAVTKWNADLEGTTLALAGAFGANGMTDGFEAGLAASNKQILLMRKEAASLPGTFAELSDVFQNMIPSAGRAGIGIDDTRKMAARTMAIGISGQIQGRVVAREIGALLEGHAGSQNVLGRKLFGLTGDRAKQFNALSGKGRFQYLQKEMGKQSYTDMIDAYSKSFTGLFTSAVDNGKQLVQAFGYPLFDSMKKVLTGINAWFTSNPDAIAWAYHFGQKISDAFDGAVAYIREWFPAVKTFGHNLYIAIRDAFRHVSPELKAMGEHVKHFLADPQAIEKMERVGKLMLLLKLGSAFTPAIGAAGSTLGSAMGIGAEGAGVAGGAGALGVAGGIAGPAILAFAGAVDVAKDSTSAGGAAWYDAKSRMDRMSQEAIPQLEQAFANYKFVVGQVSEALGTSLLGGISGMTLALDLIPSKLSIFATTLDMVIPGMGLLARLLPQGNWSGVGVLKKSGREKAWSPQHLLGEDDRERSNGKDKLAEPPNHSTHIQKVELIVQTNQDPLRVAKLAIGELDKLARNPKGARNNLIGARR